VPVSVLDNVDVKAATVAGVMVVNAPTSNITSAAELAVGLLLATARNIAPANQSLKGGQWKRSQYGGVELLDKTVGIVGLGRIGALTAERLAGFDMKLLAYDPYLSAARAGQLGCTRLPRRAAARERLHHRAPAQDTGDRGTHR
jgi:D-3-phosphoglycerate dehydrogenase